jgi:hypothetical protein
VSALGQKRTYALQQIQGSGAQQNARNPKHPDKTFIGRIERGFDFHGYRFTRAGLSLARKTVQNFIEKSMIE